MNLTSHFLLTKRVWPVLAEQGIGGSLVYVASKNAFAPGAGFGPYSVAKAGLVQLAKIAALEGGAAGIRANVVNPDAIFGGSRLWSDELRRERADAHGVAVDELEAFYAKRSLLGRAGHRRGRRRGGRVPRLRPLARHDRLHDHRRRRRPRRVPPLTRGGRMTRLMLALAALAAVAAQSRAPSSCRRPRPPASSCSTATSSRSRRAARATRCASTRPGCSRARRPRRPPVRTASWRPATACPNDNYTRDETHKPLTFVLPKTAKITVVTNGAHGIANTPVTVAEFVQLLKGKNPNHRQLTAPAKAFGYWAVVKIDTVRSLDGQYHP